MVVLPAVLLPRIMASLAMMASLMLTVGVNMLVYAMPGAFSTSDRIQRGGIVPRNGLPDRIRSASVNASRSDVIRPDIHSEGSGKGETRANSSSAVLDFLRQSDALVKDLSASLQNHQGEKKPTVPESSGIEISHTGTKKLKVVVIRMWLSVSFLMIRIKKDSMLSKKKKTNQHHPRPRRFPRHLTL